MYFSDSRTLLFLENYQKTVAQLLAKADLNLLVKKKEKENGILSHLLIARLGYCKPCS